MTASALLEYVSLAVTSQQPSQQPLHLNGDLLSRDFVVSFLDSSYSFFQHVIFRKYSSSKPARHIHMCKPSLNLAFCLAGGLLPFESSCINSEEGQKWEKERDASSSGGRRVQGQKKPSASDQKV